MEDIYKPIPSYERYKINCQGNVWDSERNIYLEPVMSGIPYPQVILNIEGINHWKQLHRLVAEIFIDRGLDPELKKVIHHIDYNKNNYDVDNLVWMDRAEHTRMHHIKRSEDNNI